MTAPRIEHYDDDDNAGSFIDDDPHEGAYLQVHLDHAALFAIYEAMKFYADRPEERTYDLTRCEAQLMASLFQAYMHVQTEPGRIERAAKTGDPRTESQKKYDAEMATLLAAERAQKPKPVPGLTPEQVEMMKASVRAGVRDALTEATGYIDAAVAAALAKHGRAVAP